MRHSALADLCPAAMHAGVFEYHCGSFRSLLLSSLRKESSTYIEFCERHQFSAPYSRMGRMHVSTIDLPDKGDKSPWKGPILPYTKKDLLAFETLYSTDGLAERSWFHW